MDVGRPDPRHRPTMQLPVAPQIVDYITFYVCEPFYNSANLAQWQSERSPARSLAPSMFNATILEPVQKKVLK